MSEIKWQDFLNLLTLKANDTGILKEIGKCSRYANSFEICYKANKTYLEEWLTKKISGGEKSVTKSEDLRLAGNKIYQEGKDQESLNTYNLSVLYAPHHSKQFGLALANRSAVLARLGFSCEAVQDIDLALQHGGSEIPRRKVLIRKALLLHKLGSFNESLQLMKTLFPDEKQLISLDNSELRDAYLNCLKKSSENRINQEHSQKSLIPLPKGGENEHFRSASLYASLKFSHEKGRHVVADTDFKNGEIIFVEKPFALVVLPDQYHQHCHHCCKELIAFIPCQHCTRARFCSDLCQTTAWSHYHQWECKGLEVCHCIGIAHLGLRVALLADSSDRYKQVYDLLPHLEDMKIEDVYQYTITAVLLTLYLEKYTSYFQCNLKVDEVGSRILRHIAQLICNGHAITKIDAKSLEKSSLKTMTEAKVRIATAIYPSASMMNHSCDQNISNSFINEYLTVRACRDIKKGEEIFNCYGPHYTSMCREERQVALREQYFFTCACPRCSAPEEVWQLQFSALLCPVCAGPVMPGCDTCSDCQHPQLILELVNLALSAQELHQKGEQLLRDGKIKEALTLLRESVTISSKCLYKHNSDLRTNKDSLARVYTELGRLDEATALVEECIESVEKQFGSNSVELSRELLKLFDLQSLELNRLIQSELQDTEEYREKLQKMKKLTNKLENIIEGNIENSYLTKIPGMVDAMNKVNIL